MSVLEKRTLVTDLDNLSEVETLVASLAEKGGLSDDQMQSLLLAASEATTNAMLHGNKMDESKYVFIVTEITDSDVRYSVEDEGDGFIPSDLPDPLNPENLLKPSGRGVFLMKTYCDAVQFDKGGRKVTLIMKKG